MKTMTQQFCKLRKNRPRRLALALLLSALLLTACGQPAAPEAAEKAEAPAAAQEPAVSAPAAQGTRDLRTDSAAPLSDAIPDSPLAGVTGLWALEEVETEGDRVSGELAGLSAELLLRPDNTADYIELTAAGQSREYLNLIVDGDGDGAADFSYDGPHGAVRCVITASGGDALELSTEWKNPDGTPGGSTLFFARRELDPRGRRLYPAELEKLTESLDYAENGFFVCAYDRPEEIDWHEVCYNGAGMDSAGPEVWRAYEDRYGELMTGLTAIRADDLEDFVWEKTQTPYALARRPLWAASWDYLAEQNVWCHAHGDTNVQRITFTDGYANGYEYYLYYTRDDWQNYSPAREYVMHCYIRDGAWQYLSNLPADAPAPVTLLNIAYCDTREKAKAMGAAELVENEPLPSDEPNGWTWAVVTAQADGVRYIVDRVEHSEELGLTLPGDNLCSGVLNAGESFAVHVNQPWHPAVHLTASLGAFWGEYVFGEDNWLHFDDGALRYVTGHDLQGEGRGCNPATEAELARFLMDGSWAYLDEAAGTPRASVWFDEYRHFYINTPESSYPVFFSYGRLSGGDAQAPELLTLERGSEESADWSALPDRFSTPALGDYSISAVQLDGEQVLYLTQTDSGGGALQYLFPGAEGRETILLHRWRGTGMLEG